MTLGKERFALSNSRQKFTLGKDTLLKVYFFILFCNYFAECQELTLGKDLLCRVPDQTLGKEF
jgi:hypothetical protein